MLIADIHVLDQTATIYMSGCNHDCVCDSPYRDFRKGKFMEMEDIVTELEGNDIKKIIVTGGDLLCQNVSGALRMAHYLRESYPSADMTLYTGIKGRIPEWVMQYFDFIKKCTPKGAENNGD